MTGQSLGFPPTDLLMGLGILPTTAGSTASPATSWMNVTKHHALYFSLQEGATSALGNGFTVGVEASEVASSSGANFGGVPFFFREAITTAGTDQPGGSTIGTQWGAWTLSTSAGSARAASTAARYLQAWVSTEQIRGVGITSITHTTGDAITTLDNKYARLKITTAGTSNGGLLSVAAHWVMPRYEQAIPTTYTT